MYHLLFKDHTASKVFSSNNDLETAINKVSINPRHILLPSFTDQTTDTQAAPPGKNLSRITFLSDDLVMYYSDFARDNFPIDVRGHTCVVNFHKAEITFTNFMSLALHDFPQLG